MPLVLLASLALTHGAAAKEQTLPAAWAWANGTDVRYHMETSILTPRGVKYEAIRNDDAKAGEVTVRADVTCKPKPEGKGWFVKCSFAWLQVTGTAGVPSDQAELDRILAEWSARLGGAGVEFFTARDGRLSEFDLTGLDGSSARENYIIECQRTLLQRAFCIFDFPLASKPDEWVRGWRSKALGAVLQLQVTKGTVGSAEVDTRHVGEEFGFLQLETSGRATLAPGESFDAGSTQMIDVKIGGKTLFDATSGVIAYRDVTLDGRLTASSVETGSDVSYFQISAVQRIDALGAPGESPLPFSALRAPRITMLAPPPPEGTPLVDFATLGMQQLYVSGLPDVAKDLGLPASVVRARVLVSAAGVVTGVTVLEGYQALKVATEEALGAAKFPARDTGYAVDVTLEWRP